MEELFENKLNDDLKNIIFSMITYSPPNELLIQINMYPYRKKYINLFYNYVMTNWTYCYIDALNIIWKLYYICIIAKGDIIWKDDNHLNYCLLNCEKYIPKEAYNIHTAELIRILNNSNIEIKKILIKKYITKYIMVLKNNHIDFLDNELSIWGDITWYGYTDESLKDLSTEVIKNAYNYPSPIIK